MGAHRNCTVELISSSSAALELESRATINDPRAAGRGSTVPGTDPDLPARIPTYLSRDPSP